MAEGLGNNFSCFAELKLRKNFVVYCLNTHHMKRKLKNLKPKNIRELKEMLIIIWNEITPDITAKLVDSMPRRVEAVLHAKGSNTKY